MWPRVARGRDGSEDPANHRLDTWKEIAAYLKRDVRTVQRWEKSEELPVHRHVHNQLPTVYAYRHELDTWWNNRKNALDTAPRVFWRSRVGRIAIALIVSIGAGLGWYLWDADLQQSSLSFEERDWLLVTPFDNRSGHPLLDGTIHFAIERELANSHFVNVVPRQRIADALQLMGKPLDTPLDRKLGREISFRDGGIRALLTGRVEKIGEDYVIWAEVVDPVRDLTIASWSEASSNEEQFWPVIQRLVHSIRAGLGESIGQIQHSLEKLEQVTTPSLSALQLFSQGDVLLHEGTPGAAAELFKRALNRDPSFAAGHMWLAWALRNDGASENEWLPHAEEAVRLSGQVSESERLVILAKAHSIRGNAQAAIPLYEALLRLDPDHYWGTNNLMWSYQKMGRLQDTLRMRTRLVRMRPAHPWAHFQLAMDLAYHNFDFEGAEQQLDRFRELLEERGGFNTVDGAWASAWMELFPVFRSLAENQLSQARAEADAIESQLHLFQEPTRSQVIKLLGAFHLTQGRVSKAGGLFGTVADPMDRLRGQLDTVFWQDDREEMERLALTLFDGGDRRSPFVATVLARTGHLSEAEETLRLFEEMPTMKHFELSLRGEIAAARGDLDTATDSLHLALQRLESRNSSHVYVAAATLARVYQDRGSVFKAVRVLEGVGDMRRLINPWSGPYWLKTRIQLLDLYDSQGSEKQKLELKARLHEFLGGEIDL